jgi:hypothetical protein
VCKNQMETPQSCGESATTVMTKLGFSITNMWRILISNLNIQNPKWGASRFDILCFSPHFFF